MHKNYMLSEVPQPALPLTVMSEAAWRHWLD